MDQRKIFGYEAETIATRYLESRGYKIVERNYRKPWGEIDIIAEKKGVMVFAEVKANAREGISEFNPEIRANDKKMKKIIKTARLYLHNKLDRRWRIDVISIIIESEKAKITHFKNVAEDIE